MKTTTYLLFPEDLELEQVPSLWTMTTMTSRDSIEGDNGV
jgi:hypothetical protein